MIIMITVSIRVSYRVSIYNAFKFGFIVITGIYNAFLVSDDSKMRHYTIARCAGCAT